MRFPDFDLKDDTGQVLPSSLLTNMHFIAVFAPDLSDDTLDLADVLRSTVTKRFWAHGTSRHSGLI